jgi:hypothetical protein
LKDKHGGLWIALATSGDLTLGRGIPVTAMDDEDKKKMWKKPKMMKLFIHLSGNLPSWSNDVWDHTS